MYAWLSTLEGRAYSSKKILKLKTLNSIYMKSTYISTWMQRMAALVFVLVGSISTSLADTKLYLENFSFSSAGETKKVAVCLDTDESTIYSVKMTLTMPTGMQLVADGINIKTELVSSRTGALTMESAISNGNIMFSDLLRSSAIDAGNGPIFYVFVKDAGFFASANASANINISGVELKRQDKSKVDGVVVTGATVTKNGGIDPATGINVAFAASEVTMAPGETKTIAVNMDNTGKTVQGFQATLDLPTGWTAEVTGPRGAVTYNASTGRITNITGISGVSGAVLNIALTAPTTFAGSAQIKLSGVKATVDYATVNLSDITTTIKVTQDVGEKPTVAFTADEIVVYPGKTGKFEVNMTNSGITVAGFQADLVLPTGWTAAVTGKRGTYTYNANNGRIMNYTGVTGDEGALFEVALTAPANFEGEAVVKLANVKTTINYVGVKLDDISMKVLDKDAAKETALADLKAEITAATTLLGEADKTVEPGLSLNNAIAAAQTAVQTAEVDMMVADAAVLAAATETLKGAEEAYAQAVEAAAKAAAETKVVDLKTAAEALAVSAEAKAYEAENVQAKVTAAETAIAAVNPAIAAIEAVIAEGKLSTDNKEALATAIATAEQAIADAQTAIQLAEEAYVLQKAADEAAALAAAKQALTDEIAAATTLLGEADKTAEPGLSLNNAIDAAQAVLNNAETTTEQFKSAVETLKAAEDTYAAAVKAAAKMALTDEVVAATTLLGDADKTVEPGKALSDAIAAAKAVLAGEATTEELNAAIETLKAAEATYAQAVAEAAAKAAAEAKVVDLKAAAEALAVSAEAKAYEAENVQAKVADAEQAIADVNTAIAAVEAVIAEGKLATDNAEALATAIATAEAKIAAAQTAIQLAEEAYVMQKAADEAAAAEAAAKEAADAKVVDLKAAAEALVISAEAKAYEAENVQAKVADAEQAIADANTAIAAVEAVIAEGKLSTDNKEALATAIATAEQAIADAQTAIQLAEEAYVLQKAADEAAALAAAKEALQDAITAAKAAETEGMTEASVQALNDAIAAAEAALAAETATVESLTAALTALNAAVAGLTPIPVPVIADGTYYIKNVASGNFLTGANSWGTQASVAPSGAPFEMVFLPEGGYSMKYILSTVNNKFLGSNLYVDSTTPAGGFVIAKNEDGTFAIKLADKYLAEGTNKGSTNDAVVVQTEELTDAAKWQILTLDEAVAAMKNAAPAGATFLISNPNFNRNTSTAAWTVSADCTNKNLGGGDNGNFCAESYHSPFTISQVLANAPAGKYQMTAQGFYRQDDGANEAAPMFFANDKEAQVPVKTGSENSMTDASHSFTQGLYTIEPIEFTVFEDGQLTIGVKNNGNTHQWVIWDNFQITYLTSEIPADEFKPAYEAALAAAQAALADEAYAAVTGDEKTALEQAIAEYSEIAEPSIDTYKAAIAALNAATSAFTGAKGAYDNFNNTAAGMANVLFPYASSAKKAAAEASIAAAPKSAAEATALTEAVLKAYRQYAESSALLEGVSGSENVTATIVNPNAEETIAEPWAVVLGEGSGGSLNILDGEPLTDGDGNSAYKYFDGGNWGATAWDVALEQTITLPAGKYYLTASGRASADVDLNLFAGETTAKFDAIGAQGGLFGRGWSDASVEFEMTEAGDIKIGVRGVTEKQYNWMSFTRFRLVKFAEIVVNPDDDVVVAPEGWTNLVANGNLAGDLNANYFSKESPSSEIKTAAIVAGAGKNHSRGIVVKSADEAAGADAWNTQFWIKVNQSLPIGTKLHVEFDYAASQAAKASTQSHGENPGQYIIWHCIGDVNFTTEWQHFSTDVEVAADMANMQCIAFNLAEEKTATEYYFDNFGVWAQIPEPVQEWENLIVNSDMEGESMECFYVTEQGVGGPYVAVATEGIGKDGSKAVKVQSADSPANNWDTQFFIRLPYQLPAGTQYKVSFDYKADKAGDFETQAHANPGQYIHWACCGSGSFTTDWQTYTAEGAIPSECDGSSAQKTFQSIAFNLALNKAATQFIFDNVKFFVPKDIVSSLTKNPDENPVPYPPTGIKNVMNEMNAEGIFNLNGQKIQKTQKGLYIINGKKVVIK